MVMNPKCATAVRAAAGDRKISDSKLQAIEDALIGTMKRLAREDRMLPPEQRQWSSMSRDQRLTIATARAMEDLQAEAALKEHRAGLQVLRAAEAEERIAAQSTLGAKTRSKALVRDIENTEDYIVATRNEAVSELTDMIDAAKVTDGAGVLRKVGMRIFDMDNPKMTADVVREIFRNGDGSTGNKVAVAGAKAWLQAIEKMRVRFNAAGGSIGKLGYGYLGQAHDAVKVAATGARGWADRVMPLLDRNQYLRVDGSLMDDVEVRSMLEAAHETIAENGTNKTEPGQVKGTGARANRGSDHRVLHFRDGDAWMAYMNEYGEGSLYDAMMGHVGAMARDIGLVERYGPNPETTFRKQADIAARADVAGSVANRSAGNTPQAYWDILSGKTGAAQNRFAASLGRDVRNWQTASKLGGAVLSATTDLGTIAATLHYNRLPYFQMLQNIGRQVTKEQRQFLQTHGIIAESLASSLNRWTGDHMTHSLSGRVAGSVMKLSFMNAWTDTLRGAFSATMMQGFAKKVGKAWGQLDEWDRFLMERKGITEADWDTISKATPTDRNGVGHLTAESIMETGAPNAREAATKWMGFVTDEAQFAVVNPDLATRAIVTGGGMPSGTYSGEAMRSVMQFKSFPLAMMTRHWRRIFDTPQGLAGAPVGFGAQTQAGAGMNRVAVLAALNVTSMMLGAIVLQNKSLVSGKDPYDMTEGKFWARAAVQGGGMGYLGDLLFKDPTEQRSSSIEQTIGTTLGPAAGSVAGLAGDVLWKNAWEEAKGEDSHIGAEALRWGNSNLPLANLWQVRPLWEHWALHHMQEAANPGYLGRMQQRAQRDWGQGYWWAPGEALPDRPPEFEEAFGR
jgi:hypothetical protein